MWTTDYPPEINRETPGCILFLLDQSGSMADSFGGGEHENKAKGVADAINRTLDTLVDSCTRGQKEGKKLIYDYFHVGVIGYGRNESPAVRPAFEGKLASRDLVPISEVAEHILELEEREQMIPDGAGYLTPKTVKFPVWFKPVAEDGTPMCKALERAHSILGKWVQSYPKSYPPIVMHLTDGEATDGPSEPSRRVEYLGDLSTQLKGLTTNHGNLLLFSCHMSSVRAPQVMFPSDEALLPDEYSQLLFRMSSVLAPEMVGAAKSAGFQLQNEPRGFVFNANLADVIRFIDIGTRVRAGER